MDFGENMSTPIALEWEKQIDLFKQRGMDIGDAKLNQEKLQHISYYRLKEFARPLAKISKKTVIPKYHMTV